MAHPTGSPLYTLLARLTVLMIPGDFFPLVAFSAVCVALALVLFLELRPVRALSGGLAAATAATLVLAAAPTFWSQATINEVYALQILLFAAFLFVWLREGVQNRLPALAFIAGLAFANHQSAIFLTPFLLERVWSERKKRSAWLEVFGFGLFGATLYLYLPLRSAQGPLLDWGGTHRWPAFWRHVTGWQYSGWVGAKDWEALSRGLQQLGGWLWGNFHVTLPIALLGLIFLFRHERRVAWVTAIAFALCIAFGLNFPNPDVEAFYILAFMMVALWVSAGIRWAYSQSHGRGVLALAFVIVAVIVSGATHYETQNRRASGLPTDWVLDAYETVEPGGVILTREWDHYSPWLYLRFVKGVRPDVTWIDTELLRRSWYPDFIRLVDPERYERARPALERLAPQIARFEAGEPYMPAEIEGAYGDAIYALSLGQPGPVYVDGVADRPSAWGVERVYLRGAHEAPWGLLTRVFRPGEPVSPLPAWPIYRAGKAAPEASPRTQFHLELYRRARQARANYDRSTPPSP